MSETVKLSHNEPHDSSVAARLNWLRAGVLGANDGIVSVAATVVGVAGVTNDLAPILVAGTAAVVGGAVSMALGEYVSVSSQSDSQRALIEKERQELRDDPDGELAELAEIYQAKGLSEATARTVAEELTAKDALKAHLSAELNIDEEEVVSPWHAAFASAIAFTVGAVLPMLAIIFPPATSPHPGNVRRRAPGARLDRHRQREDRWQFQAQGNPAAGGGRGAGHGLHVRGGQPPGKHRHRLAARWRQHANLEANYVTPCLRN